MSARPATSAAASRLFGAALVLAAALGSGGLAACGAAGDDDAAGGRACADVGTFFETRVWQSTLSTKCVACHTSEGAAKGTRLVLVQGEGAAEKNLATVERLVAAEPQLLVKKPTAQVAHGGGAVLAAESDEAHALASLVDKTQGRCETGVTAAALGQRQVRRLTRDEYAATLVDLLGVPKTYGDKLPADAVVEGFDNNAGALTVTSLYADKVRTNAEEIGKAVDLRPLVGCTPEAGKEAACASRFVKAFLERAFRRPPTAGEVARYETLHGVVAGSEGFDEGSRAVVVAALQSPSFLFRTELGAAGKDGFDDLTPWEVASELSYLFWRTMPDAELFDLARTGELAKPEVVAAQAKRLAASPRSAVGFARFVAQWLELDRLGQAVKDEATYPGFDADLRHDLEAETVALFDDVARAPDGSLAGLLGARHTFVTPKVAAFYAGGAVPPGPSQGAPSRLDVTGGRFGILAHASVLATQSTPSTASPIRRGKLVREKFFCQTIAPPPPGVAAQLAPVDPRLPNRERFAQHAKDAACAGCHRLMDPIGFGFEGFDGVGKPVTGADVRGEIFATAASDGAFEGVVDLQQKQAASPEVHACFARQWVRYAYGIRETDASTTLATEMGARFGQDGTRLAGLLAQIVSSDHFLRRRSDPDAAEPPPPGAAPAPPPPAAPVDGGSGAGGGTGGGNVQATVELIPQGAGYQKNVTVKNPATTEVAWTTRLPKDGTITNLWNADVTESGGEWVFVGKSYNAKLAPGQSTTFGFQASRP